MLVFIYSNQIECHVNNSDDVFTPSTVIVCASRCCRRSEGGGVLRRILRHGCDEWICTEMDKKKQLTLKDKKKCVLRQCPKQVAIGTYIHES
jgi:hypothetical protein